jgi:organic hydroperoxide reductase OsmC/OhrA
VRKASLGPVSAHVQANEKGHVKEIQVQLEVESSLGDEQLHHLVEVAERGCHIRALISPEIDFRLTVIRSGVA